MKSHDRIECFPIDGVHALVWRGQTLGVLFPDLGSTRVHWATWSTGAARTGTGRTFEHAQLAAVESLRVLEEPAPANGTPSVEEECRREGHRWGDKPFAVSPTVSKLFCTRCGRYRFTDSDVVP